MATKIATIPIGGTESNVISIADDEILGVILPVLVSTNLTFQTSDAKEGVFVPIQKSDLSGAYTLTGTTGGIAFWAPELAPFERLKIVSSVTQTGSDKEIQIITRKGKSD